MPKYLLLIIYLAIISFNAFSQKFEAENAILSGGAVKQASSLASGGFFVAQNEGNLTFNISFQSEATYNVYLNIAAPNGNKINRFVINGNSIDFSTPNNPAFTKIKLVSFLKLAAGSHKIEIIKSWGWINIDYIEFEKVDPLSRYDLNTKLITPNPSAEAIKLYQFLLDNYSKKIISGVMNVAEANWLFANTGKYPALVGFDFMHNGRNYTWFNEDTPFQEAKAWYDKNGIPTFCWHWRDPLKTTESFYTKDTSFDVSKIIDSNSAEYKAMLKDIDYISELLKKFKVNKIPVLWRPLHEAAGGWFWWGAKGAEPCKKLWQIMYDRMVNFHGLNNLIWVWTREPNDEAWYPGDEYVDIVGRDIYKEGDHGSQILEFNDMNARYGGKKMITISECGSFPDVDNLIKDGAAWSWFMPWYGDFTRNSKHNPIDLWKKMFASEYVITLDEMPNLKTYTFSKIDLLKNQSEFKIFPTLFDNQLTINSNQQIEKVSFYQVDGKYIRSYFPKMEKFSINTVNFKPGVYIVIANDIISNKIFKQ